jgi:hypothetical protein
MLMMTMDDFHNSYQSDHFGGSSWKYVQPQGSWFKGAWMRPTIFEQVFYYTLRSNWWEIPETKMELFSQNHLPED